MAKSFLPGQIPFIVNIEQKQKPRVETITENGAYDTEAYRGVNVQVEGMVPSGELSITENNTYDVTSYASAVVNVPNPSTGTKNITSNGNNIDVKDYAAVNVNVPNPSTGTLEITENGEGINVTQYAYVDVNVSGGGAELEADSIYRTDEEGNPTVHEAWYYSGFYFAGSSTSSNLSFISLSRGTLAYLEYGDDGYPVTLDASTGNLFFYDDSGDRYEEITSLGDHDVVYGSSGNYSTFTLQFGTYYQAGCYGAIQEADFAEDYLYIFNQYASTLTATNLTGDVSDGKLNLVSYYAGSELLCESFDIPEVGQDVTVTLDGSQFSGSFKITRLS